MPKLLIFLSLLCMLAGYIKIQQPRFIFTPPLLSLNPFFKRQIMTQAQNDVDNLINSSQVAIFSKSYCPYCDKVKGLFDKIGVSYSAIELDEVKNGQEMQKYLKSKTGLSTVPSVWISGNFIGGCDDTHKLYSNGSLKKMLSDAGISSNL